MIYSQWRKYIEFCQDNGLQVLPSLNNTVARFLVFLARTCKYSMVNNYLSAINRLHLFYGYDIDFRQSFVIKLVLSGIKRQLGDCSIQKIPLTPQQMLKIYALLNLTDESVATMWAALMFSFRSLLRKSNVVPDSLTGGKHVVQRSDVVIDFEKLVVHVTSSKTNQYRDRVLQVPIQKVDEPAFCVYTMLKRHLDATPEFQDGPLFLVRSGITYRPLLYKDLLHFLKTSVGLIGLKPDDVGLHSMRRSGRRSCTTSRSPWRTLSP